MRRKLINFFKSPTGRRLLLWAIPVVISFVTGLMSKQDEKDDEKSRQKRDKRK